MSDGKQMNAVVRDAYGGPDVLKYETIDVPVPADDEVLVRVHASSVNRGDVYMLSGTPALLRLMTGVTRPKKRGLGADVSGEVAAVGKAVADFSVGDAVFGQLDFGETWAEYACVPASGLVKKPDELSHEQAAAAPLAGLTALQGLRTAGALSSGQSVLIHGATGAVGTYAVQIARALGAHVVAVCRSPNVDLIKSIGAHEVIAHDEEDFVARGDQYDVLFDVAAHRKLSDVRPALKKKGVYVAVGAPTDGLLGPAGHMLALALTGPFVSQRVATFVQTVNTQDLKDLAEMMRSGAVTSCIDRRFPLSQTADALRYAIQGRPPAKVVLTVV